MDSEKILSLFKSTPVKDKEGRLVFLRQEQAREKNKELSQDINKLKTFVKKWPWFYNFLQALFTPAFSPIGSYRSASTLRRALKEKSEGAIINIGSGTKRIHHQALNIDIYPFKNVDIQ